MFMGAISGRGFQFAPDANDDDGGGGRAVVLKIRKDFIYYK
jgi:hypothetical protein